jgi:hypothetical protein
MKIEYRTEMDLKKLNKKNRKRNRALNKQEVNPIDDSLNLIILQRKPYRLIIKNANFDARIPNL